jgi:ribosomal-protein-alanine N-acetyltransferase
MLRPPASLETERLILRAPRITDAPAFFASYTQDPEVARFMTWRPHPDVQETRAFLQRCVEVWSDGTGFPWVIALRETGAVIGIAEIRVRGHLGELGYALARRAWGQGYMFEALRPIVAWAFDQPSIFRVWATCDVDNTRSARVLERLGMQREGRLRRWIVHPNVSPDPRDCWCYARVRDREEPGSPL